MEFETFPTDPGDKNKTLFLKRNPLYLKGGEVGFSTGIVFGSNFK